MTDQNTIDMEPSQPKRAVAKREARAVAVATPSIPTTPMDLLRIVTERGASVDEIGKFMDLMERQQANEARQAFVRAMAAFKRNPPDIYKDKAVDFTSQKGRTHYMHATLGNICEQIIGALAQHGISHSWTVEQPSAREVVVTCVLTHELGHSERVQFRAMGDDTGNKNPIQQMASAITYCQRYTLLAACGIAVKDGSDDDGAGTGLNPNAVRDAVAEKAPAKHKIGQSQLNSAIASIQAGDYSFDELVGYYDLAAEQLAHTKKQLGMPA